MNCSIQNNCVSVPPQINNKIGRKAKEDAGFGVCNNHDSGGLYLLSNNLFNDSKPTIPSKPTNNRKQVSYDGVFTHEGVDYRVNVTKGSGVYVLMVERFIDLLNAWEARWKRVFLVRIDLHSPVYKAGNSDIRKFRKNLARRILRKYRIKKFGWFWAREVGKKGDGLHYHCAILLNGKKVQWYESIVQMARDTWGSFSGFDGVYHSPSVPNPFYDIKGAVTKAEAIYRMSYLCKESTKGIRSPRANDFGCSALPKANKHG